LQSQKRKFRIKSNGVQKLVSDVCMVRFCVSGVDGELQLGC
jgi:hypothetical protein